MRLTLYHCLSTLMRVYKGQRHPTNVFPERNKNKMQRTYGYLLNILINIPCWPPCWQAKQECTRVHNDRGQCDIEDQSLHLVWWRKDISLRFNVWVLVYLPVFIMQLLMFLSSSLLLFVVVVVALSFLVCTLNIWIHSIEQVSCGRQSIIHSTWQQCRNNSLYIQPHNQSPHLA